MVGRERGRWTAENDWCLDHDFDATLGREAVCVNGDKVVMNSTTDTEAYAVYRPCPWKRHTCNLHAEHW
jgi:hypothetical protein